MYKFCSDFLIASSLQIELVASDLSLKSDQLFVGLALLHLFGILAHDLRDAVQLAGILHHFGDLLLDSVGGALVHSLHKGIVKSLEVGKEDLGVEAFRHGKAALEAHFLVSGLSESFLELLKVFVEGRERASHHGGGLDVSLALGVSAIEFV